MTTPSSTTAPYVRWESNTWTGSGEGRINEDFALVEPAGLCAVLVDGATGLTKANVVAGESDAAWFARNLTRELVAGLSDPVATAEEVFPAAGARVAARFRCIPGASELQRIDEPNGSVAALRWTQGSATIALLGDCTVVALMADGSTHVFHDDTLTKLDDLNYERMYAWATERGATMAEARRALNPRFVENRLKMNEPGGYWAADISCRGMTHLLTYTLPLEGVAGLFACSDGYAAAVDMGVVTDAGELARHVAAGQGPAVGEELRAAERADAGCWRVHRSKTSDDATYLYVGFDVQV